MRKELNVVGEITKLERDELVEYIPIEMIDVQKVSGRFIELVVERLTSAIMIDVFLNKVGIPEFWSYDSAKRKIYCWRLKHNDKDYVAWSAPDRGTSYEYAPNQNHTLGDIMSFIEYIRSLK